jgi:hypothetical protein
VKIGELVCGLTNRGNLVIGIIRASKKDAYYLSPSFDGGVMPAYFPTSIVKSSARRVKDVEVILNAAKK